VNTEQEIDAIKEWIASHRALDVIQYGALGVIQYSGRMWPQLAVNALEGQLEAFITMQSGTRKERFWSTNGISRMARNLGVAE
jgi:hypothetical protein